MAQSAAPSAPPPTSAQTEPLEDMGLCIARAFYDFRSLLGRLLAEAGLSQSVSPGMGPVLYALFERDGCTIKEIAARTRLAPCTLTGQLGRMKRAGLVRQRTDRQDRRAVRVWLTPKGKRTRPRLRELHRRVMEVLQADANAAEFERTRRGLAGMIESMRVHERRSSAGRAAAGGGNGRRNGK